MESVRDTELNGITLYRQDIKKDRKDAVYVRYSFNGKEMPIVLVVTIN